MSAKKTRRRWVVIGVAVIGVITLGVCLFFAVLYPLKYRAEIKQYSAANELPPELVAALINAESGFRADSVSGAGAVGLMQLLPTTANYTAQKFNMSPAVPDLFSPAENIAVGTRYLRYLIDRFGDMTTALFAYNAGEGNVAAWLTERGEAKLTECPFPETNAYVAKIQNSTKWYRWRI